MLRAAVPSTSTRKVAKANLEDDARLCDEGPGNVLLKTGQLRGNLPGAVS